jgi:5'-3' exonuclease
VYGSLQAIQGVLSSTRAKKCFVTFDAGVSKRRREMLPEYRGPRHREPNDPHYQEKDPEKVKYDKKFDYQRSLLLLAFRKLGIRSLRIGGWEADDLIYAITNALGESTDKGLPINIITNDRDLLQLINSHTIVTRPTSGQIVTEENFEEEVGYPQDQFLIRRAIIGEGGSDNIPGIPGVAGKTAALAFEDGAPVCPWPFEDLFNFCSDHKSARVRKISDNIDILMRNHRIIDLTEEDHGPIKEGVSKLIRSPVGVDLIGVKKLLTELDMFSITKDLHIWIAPFHRLS